MSYKLVSEVLNHAPQTITAGQRLVLLVIAEAAQDDDRRSWLSAELLSRRTGLNEDTARRAAAELEKAGHLIRVPLGVDKNGKRVLAVKGRSPVYEVPRFLRCDVSSQEKSSQDQISQDDPSPKVGPFVAKGGMKSPTHPSRTRKNHRPPWCGREGVCDERTRLIEVGDECLPAKCPECHPANVRAVRSYERKSA